MIPRRLDSQCLLRPEDMPASQDDMHVVGVFNPGVATTANGTVLLVRVAEAPLPRPGWIGLPRWNIRDRRIECDWVHEADILRGDSRSVRFRCDGTVRLTFVSHLRVIRLAVDGGIQLIEARRFLPEDPLEEYGVEDPRITRIGDVFYITYVAVSAHGPATALASTRDFRDFHRHGVIFCPDNKDVVLWPEKILGRHLALHRPSLSAPLTRPEIWSAKSTDLMRWGEHRPLYAGSQKWERARVGAGTPPIRTRAGWLSFYHGKEAGEDMPGSYRAGLLLHDINEPTRIIASAGPVFVPQEDYEHTGFVPDVVFPTGLTLNDDLVTVYYGAANAVTGAARFRLDDLLECVAQREPIAVGG